MDQTFSWLKNHATAILATAIAVAKAGVLGKGFSTIVLAFAAAAGSLQ